MISREFLSEVLKIDVIDNVIDGDIITYTGLVDIKSDSSGMPYEVYGSEEINIYKFASICKEWAFDRGFAFIIEYLGKKDINIQLINCHNEKIQYSKDFYNIENIEHIFIPCEWILSNLKGNK